MAPNEAPEDVKLELVVNEKAEAFVFHNKAFQEKTYRGSSTTWMAAD